MVFQLYKSRLKCLLRNRVNIFWSYAFPILLASLFYFAFTDMFSSNNLETISIAYVEDVGYKNDMDYLKDVLEEAEISQGLPLFNVRYLNVEEASKALGEDEITAYIVNGEGVRVYVKKNGISETIVKSFLDSYKRSAYTIQAILMKNPDALSQGLLDDIMEYKSFTSELDKGAKPDITLTYFYALLAMTCMMAANWGLDEVINIQGNRSSRGARINVSPIHKMKLLIINMLAAFTAHAAGICLLIIYMLKVLKISFGGQLPQMVLACLIGEMFGLFFGAAVGVWVNKSTGVQDAITTSFTLISTFLSGMMIVEIKGLIVKKVPIVPYINPVSLISDSFYSLYYYDDLDRFYVNTSILLFMSVALGVISYLGLRRKTYASI